MIAGGEGVPVIFFSLKIGMPKSLRVLKNKRNARDNWFVLLNECLIIHFFRKGAPFVFCRGRDEVDAVSK